MACASLKRPKRRTRAVALALAVGAVAAPSAAGPPSTRALVFNCFTCHGTDGRSPGAMHSINGKSDRFLREKLTAFRAGRGDPTIMDRIARGYSDEEIARIAGYLAELD